MILCVESLMLCEINAAEAVFSIYCSEVGLSNVTPDLRLFRLLAEVTSIQKRGLVEPRSRSAASTGANSSND
jgi:hypothetical protein